MKVKNFKLSLSTGLFSSIPTVLKELLLIHDCNISNFLLCIKLIQDPAWLPFSEVKLGSVMSNGGCYSDTRVSSRGSIVRAVGAMDHCKEDGLRTMKI